MKPDYNIEFSHIYSDETFGDEQLRSMQILKKVVSNMEKENKTFVVSILIDEFHPTTFILDEEKIVSKFKKYGITVDFVGYESKFGGVADKVIKNIPKSLLKFELFDKSQKEVLLLRKNKLKIGLKEKSKFGVKHTCALLSASWTLCRLGAFRVPLGSVRNFTGKSFDAKKTITILPEKYRSVECNVINILNFSKFRSLAKNTKYHFFK